MFPFACLPSSSALSSLSLRIDPTVFMRISTRMWVLTDVVDEFGYNGGVCMYVAMLTHVSDSHPFFFAVSPMYLSFVTVIAYCMPC